MPIILAFKYNINLQQYQVCCNLQNKMELAEWQREEVGSFNDLQILPNSNLP